MAGYKIFDFKCTVCSMEWEDLVRERVSICPDCGALNDALLSAPRLNTHTKGMMDGRDYAAMMHKRSDDHTARQIKKGEKA